VFANPFYWLKRLAVPPVFVIELEGGRARLTKGMATALWTSDCAEIAAEFGIAHGYVEGVRTPWGLGLRFSPDVPKECHQRFRNVFATHLPRR
jgi:hypothetical protein